MQFFSCLISLVVIFVSAVTAVAQPAYQYPDDPDVPVLKVNDVYRTGGDSPPLVLIYGDGRIVKPVSDNPEQDFVITVDQERLNTLLSKIIEDNQFLEIDAEDIKDEVLTARKRSQLRPGFDFRIELNLADQQHVVAVGHSWVYQRLSRGRTRHADAERFQQFLNIEELSIKLSRWAMIGGEEAMQTILEAANKKTQEEYPGAPKISEAKILSLKSENGRAILQFGTPKTGDIPALYVIVGKNKGEEDFDTVIKINKPRQFHGGR